MKVRAIKQFRDKYTHRKIYANNIFDVTEQRMDEINAAKGGPYVTVTDEPVTEGQPSQKREKKQTEGQPQI